METPMLDRLARLLQVSTPVAAILLALIVVQVALLVYSLVDLARRDAVSGGRKWVWALVIVFLNIPGAIAYLVAGRPAPTLDGSSGVSAGGGDAARRAVDALYSPRDRR
jgi:phospholipase D-like protein